MAWQHISPEVSVKGFKCISIAVGGIDAFCCGMTVKRMEMRRKMKALTIKILTVTLIGKVE